MHLPKTLLGLPGSLLLLVAAQLRAQELPPAQLPTAIKKMPPDSGEKLLPGHYAFAPLHGAAAGMGASQPALLGARSPAGDKRQLLDMHNGSSAAVFSPPFVVHYNDHDNSPSPPPLPLLQRWRSGERGRQSKARSEGEEVLARLWGRGFSCPPDTASCADIGLPNYCCEAGTTCYEVDGAPESGNLGCCPEGLDCEGSSVGDCSGDAVACSAEVGGGCCIAGFVCAQVGCKFLVVIHFLYQSTYPCRPSRFFIRRWQH